MSLSKIVYPKLGNPPFTTIGLFTFLRTYARRHRDDDPKSTIETWDETIQRVVNACNRQLKVGFSEDECKELYTLLYNLKCSVAGRFLWQLGTGTVERLGLPSLQNCSFTVIDEPIRPFTWCMNFLMLGCVPPDTPVLCESGIKPIKDIYIGDKVWSYNIKLGQKELREVIGIHDPIIPKDMNIQLNCKYGSLTTSKKHPILVYRNKNWEYVKAGDIKVGDILQKYHKENTEKDIVEDIQTDLNISENWKDITVDANNNYYAGEGSFYCTHNCGVGYRLLPSDVEKLPEVKYALITRKDTHDADFIVPDSREGWVKLLAKVLKAHFYSGKGFTYSCINLRSKGAPIKTFGGIASGPDVLCDGMTKISSVLNRRVGQKARPIDCLDIMNIIGMVVVSGNVRRSAQLAIGDCKDKEFLNAKNWALGNIPNWRAYSNNSVVCNDIKDILENEDFWRGYDGSSEPYGLINLKLSRECGRAGETKYSDCDVGGYNPCAEISISPWETCCLGELYLPNISSREELYKCTEYIYRICKHSLTLPCRDSDETERVVHKNMRIGIGVTGYLQATEEQRSWLPDCYKHLREFDKLYSQQRGFPTSIKLTTSKPSGCGRGDMLIQTSKGLLRMDEIGDAKGEQWQNIDNLQVTDDKAVGDDFKPKNCTKKCQHIFKRGEREGEKCNRKSVQTYCSIHIGFHPESDSEDENQEEKKTTMYTVKKFYVNGKVPTKKITTSDGLELEVSLNHRFRVIENGKYIWKYSKDLKKGDNLAVLIGDHPEDIQTELKCLDFKKVTNCQMMNQPKYLTKDIAWFIGLFYGDGSVHEKGIRIAFNRKQTDLLVWLQNFFSEVFNLTTKIDDDYAFYVNSTQFLKWLDVNGVKKEFCDYLKVPKVIRTSSKENAQAFISGFWRADGGLHNIGNMWSLCSVSKSFMQEMLVLCRSVGYNVKVSCAGPSSKSGGLGSNDRWIISIRNEDKTKNRYRSGEFKKRLAEPFWLDPVDKIEDSECDTYDIEVDSVHHYRMGGVVSHNTLSLLGNTTPGIHPGFARYYLRRIRISSESQLIKIAKEHGYPVEYSKNFDGTFDHNTQIITFPHKLPDNTVIAENCSAVDQLNWVKRLQKEWSDNSVSVSVYYRKHELPEIKEWLKENYNTNIKTVSFLLHSDHGFIQAPMEQITKEEYEKLASQCRPISDLNGICYVEDTLEADCGGNACPVK